MMTSANSSGVLKRACDCTTSWKAADDAAGGELSAPAATWTFCSCRAVVTSVTERP